MADTARIFGAEAERHGNELMNSLGLQEMTAGNQHFILATIHRAENTDDPVRLESILKVLGAVATTGVVEHDPLPVLLPLHPRTKSRISTYQLEGLLEPFVLTPPLGFLEMVLLERRASLVVTDSGGVQKEAFLQSTPCVTVRTETEWVELLECGWNKLADPRDSLAMLKAIGQQLSFDSNYKRPQVYGDGYAAEKIIARISQM